MRVLYPAQTFANPRPDAALAWRRGYLRWPQPVNFSPKVKAWITLVSLVLSTGIGTGYAAFLTGASPLGSVIVGLGTASTNVYHALAASPKEKASTTQSPFNHPSSNP